MALSVQAQLVLSAVFLALGLWLLARGIRWVPIRAAVILLALCALLLFATHFVSDYFTGEGVNEAVIYHLRYGLGGAGFAQYAGLIAAAALGAFAAAALLWWLARRGRSRGAVATPLAAATAFASVCLAVAIHPALAPLSPLWRAASAGATGSPAPAADPGLQVEFDRYYRSPRAVRRETPRNLVFIYLEGFERNYFDETLFPGLVTELRALERRAVTFTGIEQVRGTGWTIAGMVASQCAIPLIAPDNGNAMTGMDTFLPGATCLGDLLQREDYRLVYFGGANLSFSGKDKFYASHGFNEAAGRVELAPKLPPQTSLSSWGLYDDALFDLAYQEYAELARAGGRFALFLLTLDTHHPHGIASPACASAPYGDGHNPMLNAVRCTDRLARRFVARIEASPWGKDTVIVIASDHLAMNNSAYDRLTRRPRHDLLMVIDPRRRAGERIATPGSMLDVAPTVMSFLGYDAEIGLGTPLTQTSEDARSRAAQIRGRLQDWRVPLLRFWGFPRIEHYLAVDPDRRMLVIDEHEYRVPSLVQVDGKLETVISFPRTIARADEAVQPAGGGPFLLVAPCIARDSRMHGGEVCLFAGREGGIRSQLIVRRPTRFSPDEIRRMLGMSG